MIDLNWIASQPKPVAIHCPTYEDIVEVLTDVDTYRVVRYCNEIEDEAQNFQSRYGDRTCVRIKFLESGHIHIGKNSYSFYLHEPEYMLVSISDVRLSTKDFGELLSDEMNLSMLFGTEESCD